MYIYTCTCTRAHVHVYMCQSVSTIDCTVRDSSSKEENCQGELNFPPITMQAYPLSEKQPTCTPLLSNPFINLTFNLSTIH